MRFKKIMHNLYGRLSSQEQAFLAFMYSSIPLRWWKKKGFCKYLEFLRGSQWESAESHKSYQEQQLLALVKYASTSTVPKVIWNSGNALNRNVNNRLAEKRASKSIVK